MGEKVRVVRVAHHAVVTAWRERERALRVRGADVRLLTSHRWNAGGRDVKLSADGDDLVHGARTVGSHPNRFVFDPLPLWRALRTQPDLIDLHEEPFSLATAEVLLLRRLLRVRAPYLVHSAQSIERRHPIPFRWFERAALRGAAGAYVCNGEAGEILRRKGLRGPAAFVPLGVDVSSFHPDGRTHPHTEPVVGYVGRLEPYEGVDTLLHAASTRPAWRVRITGDGPERASLQSLAHRLGIDDRVEFLGCAENGELARRYRGMDVLAVPSIPWPGWLEQVGRVAVEAMASGVPVVASRSGVLPDVVGSAGIVVSAGDVVELAEGIDRVLETDRWQELRVEGRRRAQEFSWERVADLQVELYHRVAPENALGREHPPHVLIVAYGSPDLLQGALEDVGDGFPMTVVDNSSSRRVREISERLGAYYIDPGRNLGFAAGVNRGLRSLRERQLASADVLLLNPDARISAEGILRLHEQLHRSTRLAAVGAAQTDPVSGDQLRVWWPFPTPGRAWVEAMGLGRFNRAREFAIGSILLLRAEAIAEVGVFDEQFFLYAEEVDWQKRAKDMGWTIDVVQVTASHVGAGTGGDPTRRELLFHASAEKYQRKHYSSAGWATYRAALILGSLVRGVLLPGARGQAARRRARLYLRGPVASATRAS